MTARSAIGKDIASGGALAIAAAVRAGQASAVQIAEAALARIEADDPALNSFTTVTAERALA